MKKKYKRIRKEVTIIKHLRKLVEGFNDSDENSLNKRLLESLSG